MGQKKLNGGKWASDSLRGGVCLRQDCQCIYCGSSEFLTLDHIIARNTIGKADNRHQNLVCACLSCNSKRQDSPIIAFLKNQGYSNDKIVAIMEQVEIIRNSSDADFAPYRKQARDMRNEFGTITVITGGKPRK